MVLEFEFELLDDRLDRGELAMQFDVLLRRIRRLTPLDM